MVKEYSCNNIKWLVARVESFVEECLYIYYIYINVYMYGCIYVIIYVRRRTRVFYYFWLRLRRIGDDSVRGDQIWKK